MATLTVRNVDDAIVRQLSIQAAEKGISREEEHRRILKQSLCPSKKEVWAELARLRAETPPQTTDSTDLIREDRDSRR